MDRDAPTNIPYSKKKVRLTKAGPNYQGQPFPLFAETRHIQLPNPKLKATPNPNQALSPVWLAF